MPTRDEISGVFQPSGDAPPVEWSAATCRVAYHDALHIMDHRVAAIIAGQARESVWLVEHPPVYTAGTSARPGDLHDPRFPVVATGRGGQYTYHGPGQRVAYVMLDLKRRKPDVRAFIAALEAWIVAALGRFSLRAGRREDRVGVWVARPDKAGSLDGRAAEDKIAAIGIRLRHWVSFHGIAINVEPELSHFAGIVPCGIADSHYGVTSLVDLGYPVAMGDLDGALRAAFESIFGPTIIAEPPGLGVQPRVSGDA